MPIQRFRQFRLQTGSVEELNREFDLVRVALDSIDNAIASSGLKGDKGDAGSGDKWELEFSMGYGATGAQIIDYVDPSNDGYLWFTPYTRGGTTSVNGEIFHTCEWRPEKSYSSACLVLDVNDLVLGIHTLSIDIEVVKNSTPVGIGEFGMTSGAYHFNSGYSALTVTNGDTIGLRAKLHHNPGYPPTCPGPDSTIYMTGKIILKN